jgi:hypothetical protein
MSDESRVPSHRTERVDLREGYRVQVEPMIAPSGTFGARLYRRTLRQGDKTAWKKVEHPIVIASNAEQAANDLMAALNTGTLPGVEAAS